MKSPSVLPALEVHAKQLVAKSDGVNAIPLTNDVGGYASLVYCVFPSHQPSGSLERVHVAHIAIGSDDHKFVSDERVPVKLALVAILGDVILPLHLSGRLVESANLAVARTYDKEVTHDRGR